MPPTSHITLIPSVNFSRPQCHNLFSGDNSYPDHRVNVRTEITYIKDNVVSIMLQTPVTHGGIATLLLLVISTIMVIYCSLQLFHVSPFTFTRECKIISSASQILRVEFSLDPDFLKPTEWPFFDSLLLLFKLHNWELWCAIHRKYIYYLYILNIWALAYAIITFKYVHYIPTHASVHPYDIYIYTNMRTHVHICTAQPYSPDCTVYWSLFSMDELTSSLSQPVISRIILPPKCLCHNLQSPQICYHTWQKELCTCD